MPFFLCLALTQLVAMVMAGEAEDAGFSNFKQAVLDSYDDNKSFQDNLFESLAILCPESVYCPEDERSSGEYENTTETLSKIVSIDNTSRTALRAREVVRSNLHRMKGCCEPCSCSKNCHERKTCCPDLAKSQVSRSNVEQTCVYEGIRANLGFGITLRSILDKDSYSYYMVTDCFTNVRSTRDEDAGRKCKHPNVMFSDEIIPVYSNATGRIYRNQYCATCNNDVSDMTSWNIAIMMPMTQQLYDVTQRTPESLYKYFLETSVRVTDVYFEAPGDLRLNEDDFLCQSPSNKIMKPVSSVGDETNFLSNACREYEAFYRVSPSKTFFKVFCALVLSKDFPQKEKPCKISRRKFIAGNWFSALLNIRKRNPDIRTNKRKESTNIGNLDCPCTAYYDPKDRVCRTISCPLGKYYIDDCNCKDVVNVLSGLFVRVNIELKPDFEINGSVWYENLRLDREFLDVVEYKLNATFGHRYGFFYTFFLFRETSNLDIDHDKVITISYANVYPDQDALLVLKKLWEKFEKGVSVEIWNRPFRLIFGTVYEVVEHINAAGQEELSLIPSLQSSQLMPHIVVTKPFYDIQISHVLVLSKLMFCRRIKLNADESKALVNASFASGYTFTTLGHVFRPGGSELCFDDYILIFRSYAPNLICMNKYLLILNFLLFISY